MNFQSFFSPKSVAIVGASRHPGKVGYEILANMLAAGYEGQIFPVNPRAQTLADLRCYPDLPSIGQVPELVVIIVPAEAVPDVLKQCAKVGAKSVVIISAGFKEAGEEGADLEKQIVRIAKQAGIRIVGPNCLGVLVPANKLNASFASDMPAEGPTGYLSQSGALLAAVLDMAISKGVGFSKLVSVGNKADVDELDVIRAMGDDPDTKVIAGFLESISNGSAFVSQAEAISAKKPILLMKPGGTEAGAKAAASHTGSLAGDDAAYECVFERAGIIRCDSLKSQLDYIQAFANQPLPVGIRIAVMTNAGGAGIMAADAIERGGLAFAELSPDTLARLAGNLPPAASLHNPVDVMCDAVADRYKFALSAILDDSNVDIALVLLTPQAMTEPAATARAVVEIAGRKSDKVILACFLGASKMEEGTRILREGKIPCYDSPETAVRTIKVMTDYVRWRCRPKRVVELFRVNRRKAQMTIEKHQRQADYQIGEVGSKEILEAYGFAIPKASIATTPEQAANIAQQLGFPVALKIWSAQIVHKTDVGGVKLGLQTPEEVMDAFDLVMYRVSKKLPDATILGVLVQEMVKKGVEVILGMKRVPQFGPLMMFGMGGIMVEVLRDVSFYLAPLTAEEAKQMLVSTKTYQMLRGVRGQQGVDIEMVAEGLQRLSQLAMEFPQIQEVDINPYVVGPKGTIPIAVDARMSLAHLPTGGLARPPA
ncbi:MAG: acyl-CoA synthetase [Planctomycetes bacterium RBG_16_55_9]|nr:MAG: acyl-CoA synthetase [Planctomycetes bacterium RBG_16_55_9]